MNIESLSLQVIKAQDLTEKEYTEILELCSQAYERDFKPFMDTFSGATHVLGRFQSTLVTHALWVIRWLQTGTLPLLQTAFVEAVATEKKYRDKGFASAVMKKLAEEISQFDLGALCTGSPELYARLGWKIWKGPLFIRTQLGLIPTPNELVLILLLPNTPPLDLEAPLSAEWREGELW